MSEQRALDDVTMMAAKTRRISRDSNEDETRMSVIVLQNSELTMALAACPGFPLDILPDDALHVIVSYLDFDSCVRFLRHSNRCLRDRTPPRLWELAFERFGYSKQDASPDLLQEVFYRRRLSNRLSSRSSGFSLPQRCFSFIPVVPPGYLGEDPPPAFFDCDSFVLTSTGVSAELLFLDPFTGQLSVWHDLLEQAVPGDSSVCRDGIVQLDTALLDGSVSHQMLLDDPVPDDWDVHPIEQLHGNMEGAVDLAYMGIDSKPVLRSGGEIEGTMVAVGRIFSDDSFRSSTEIIAWFRESAMESYADQHVCRFATGFREFELCPVRRVVYTHQGGSRVSVFSMSPRSSMAVVPGAEPLFSLECSDDVTAMAVDPTGSTLLISTRSGSLQVWDLRHGAKLAACIDTFHSTRKAFPGTPLDSSICEIVYARDRPLSTNGFVTLHHRSNAASQLVLWRFESVAWKIASMVSLPLSSRRRPVVRFDGRRVIVLGQDHIGVIILVYVLDGEGGNDGSGGVVNGPHTALHFANRIRHVALSEVHWFDQIDMTCNERFLIVNTKAGHLLSLTECLPSDGLLVIDLDDPRA